MKTIENTNKLLKFVAEKFENNEINNTSLVQLIELCGNYLNLETLPKYATRNNMSYNGVKKFRKVITLFGVKLVQEND
jgi:hypothetical protein